MKTIDLTTKESALAYLRSLRGDEEIVLPGAYAGTPKTPACDALEVIVGMPCNDFGVCHKRWTWTVSELLDATGHGYGSCTCHHPQGNSPVPNYCPIHDGDYSSFLVMNNCD
jgi:hypothetical protein